MSDINRFGPSTRAVHAGDGPRTAGAPVVNPIMQTSTFYSEAEGGGEVRYTRYGNNPNHTALETRIASLEGAEDCAVLGSGMAAMTAALLATVGAGDHVLASDALYGGTRTLLDHELSRLGIESSYADFTGSDWQTHLRPNTRCVVVETPSNPVVRVLDLAPIAAATHAAGAALVVDATFATPINLRPLEHGADYVVHSATKYLGGHSDVSAGCVSGARDRIVALRKRARIFGAALDPHAAWLVERGIKTLAVRMERHNRNGQAVAEWCEAQTGVARVHYPGLPSHPDHALAGRTLAGFGAMLGLVLTGGDAAATRFIGALRLAKAAPSLGGVETLVSEPRFTSHMAFSPEERARQGIEPGFVRFSLGIEDPEDLIDDVRNALQVVNG